MKFTKIIILRPSMMGPEMHIQLLTSVHPEAAIALILHKLWLLQELLDDTPMLFQVQAKA